MRPRSAHSRVTARSIWLRRSWSAGSHGRTAEPGPGCERRCQPGRRACLHRGFGALTEGAFLSDFANGVDPVRARILYAVQGRVSESLFHEKTTVAAWRSKPSWYAISRQDRTTSPELERFLAKRMNATTVEIDSGHLSLITHPHEVTQLILDAVQATRR